MNIPKPNGRPSMVEQVQAQTAQALSLSQIADQRLLADPRTNPATREHADRLRDDQQRTTLTLEHRRVQRRGRVADRRAGHAERALQAIQAARETASPALSVVALHAGRRRYMGVALTASVALSVGSALGVEAAAQGWGAPTGVGYLTEIGLTGLATSVILYRSHLAQHTHGTGTAVPVWQARMLWVLMLAPLLGSVVASTAGSGPIGALCSIGAVCFALLAYVIADRSSALMQATAALVDTADEDELRRQSAGEEWFTPLPAEEVEEGATEPEDEGAAAVAQIEEWLGERARTGHDVADHPNAPPVRPVAGARHINGATRHIVVEQGFGETRIDGGESTERHIAASEARRLQGAHTRIRVADYVSLHPEHTPRKVAEALGIGQTTARRPMRELAEEGEE